MSRVEILRLTVRDTACELLQEELSKAERLRARSFRQPMDCARFVLGRAALRRLLGGRLGLPPARVPLVEGRNGRPELDGHGGLSFNLSHSGRFVLIAIAEGRMVGIDVEAWAPVDLEAVASLVFSPGEQRELAACEEPGRAHAFFRCWVRKEAVLKAEGSGFTVPAHLLHVGLDDAFPRQVEGTRGRRWWVEDLPMPAGHAAAIAVEGGPVTWVLRDDDVVLRPVRARTPGPFVLPG